MYVSVRVSVKKKKKNSQQPQARILKKKLSMEVHMCKTEGIHKVLRHSKENQQWEVNIVPHDLKEKGGNMQFIKLNWELQPWNKGSQAESTTLRGTTQHKLHWNRENCKGKKKYSDLQEPFIRWCQPETGRQRGPGDIVRRGQSSRHRARQKRA